MSFSADHQRLEATLLFQASLTMTVSQTGFFFNQLAFWLASRQERRLSLEASNNFTLELSAPL